VDAVEVEVKIEASPETVFEFFTDPDKMIQWMGRRAELDPRPGGSFCCDLNGDSIASGEFLVVEPPSRLVFSFGWEGEGSVVKPGSSTIEILLEPDGDGTRARLLHTGLPSAEWAEKHSHGWSHYLDRLAIAGAGGDPGADTMGQ
jgi:uncharacterized protein YndB with AHSA1/START domain